MNMKLKIEERKPKKTLLLLVAAVCTLLVILTIYWLDFGDFVRLNERVVVSNQDQVIALLKRNTPVRFELVDERWGTAILDSPEELYQIWSVLETLEPVPGPVGQRDHIKGKIYFFDGEVEEFAISNRFQLGDFVLGNRDEEMKVTNLFQILLHTLRSQDNLVNLIRNSDNIYLLEAGVPLVPGAPGVVELTPSQQAKLVDQVLQSERVMDSSGDLNDFLRTQGSNPLYNIMLVRNGEPVPKYVVISVLSDEFYSVMDFSYLDRNILYFRGKMLEFAQQTYGFIREEAL